VAVTFLQLAPIRHQVAIAGRVTDAQTGQALAGAQVVITAAPVEFTVKVQLRAKQNQIIWETLMERLDRTQTARDGHFHFIDLPIGQYTLTASLPGAGSRYGTASVQENVALSGTTGDPSKLKLATADIALSPTTLAGQITITGTNQPVFLAKVQVQGSGEQVFSDARGRYLLTGLESGTRTVAISAQGYKTSNHIVQLSQIGAEQQLNSALEKEGQTQPSVR